MTILHHPPEEVLLGYATGGLGRGPSLVVQAHLHACPACRAQAERLEAIGGQLIEDLPPAEMAPDALDRMLARLDEPEPPPPPRPPRGAPAGIDLSGVLRGVPLGPKRWLGPGLWIRNIAREPGGGSTYLLSAKPGRRIDRHTHTGSEYVCVLTGAYSDETGRYGAGDFAYGDEDLSHTPTAEDDGDCLCLIFNAGPLRFASPLARLAQTFIGL